MNFAKTGSFKRWLFTEKELEERRITALQKASSPLTLDEEVLLVRFFIQQAISICTNNRFPERVADTSALFLLRLYSKSSLSRRDPKIAMITCILLSCKVEEHWIPGGIERFCEQLQVDPFKVLAFESVLLSDLCFDLGIFLPRRALHGLLSNEHFLNLLQRGTDEKNEIIQASNTLLHSASISDVLLLRPPSQIAFAILEMAASKTATPDQTISSVNTFFQTQIVSSLTSGSCTNEDSQSKVGNLVENITKIKAMITEAMFPLPREKLSEIDKKLKSAIQQRKQQKQVKEEQQ